MNKNVLIALGGTIAFVAVLVIMWGIGGGGGGKDQPAPSRNDGSALPPKQGGPAKAPEKPAPIPDIPVPPVKPGPDPVIAPKPDPAVENPPVKPVPAADPGTPEVYVLPGAKPRISFDPAELDESKRIEAAGRQEIPMPWLRDKGPKEPPANEAALPATYTVPNDMSLYRVAEIVYGNAQKWTLLFEANKAALEDPEKVRKGTVLRIPDPASGSQDAPKKKGSGIVDGLF